MLVNTESLLAILLGVFSLIKNVGAQLPALPADLSRKDCFAFGENELNGYRQQMPQNYSSTSTKPLLRIE